MRFFSRLRRRFLSQTKLARVILGLALLLLVGTGLFLVRIIKRPDTSLPDQITLLVWQTSSPPVITLFALSLPNKSVSNLSLDPAKLIPSGGFTLAQSVSLGNTRKPPSGGLVLAKSAASEITNKSVDYIVVGSPSDIVSLQNYSLYPQLLLWPPNYIHARSLLFSTLQTDISKDQWWRILRTDLVYHGL